MSENVTQDAHQEGRSEECEPLTVTILKDVLDGIEEYFGAEGLAQVVAFAHLKNKARETNNFIDELERTFGISSGHRISEGK